MSERKETPGFGTRLINFISAFDTSPGDYLFDSVRDSRSRLQELEARVARLEGTAPTITEVPEREVV